MHDNGEQLPEATKAAIQSQIDAVKEVLSGGGSADAMETAVNKLQSVLNEAGAAMYQQPGAAGPSAANGSPEGDSQDDEDVIEGEFS